LFKKSSELERKVEAAREDLAAAQKKRKLLTKLRDILVEKRAAEKEIIKLHVTERTLKNESK
jgi:flagellar biosynthesis chaperone FliJ